MLSIPGDGLHSGSRVGSDHPSTSEDREPDVVAGLELRGEAGSMPDRVGVIRPAVKPVVWLDPDQ